jgi:hypothetical protein
MISSTRAGTVAGTSRPSALAVLRLIINSNLVGRITGRSVENAAGVVANQPVSIDVIHSIAHKASDDDIYSERINCGYRITGSQRGNLLALAEEKRIAQNYQTVGSLWPES